MEGIRVPYSGHSLVPYLNTALPTEDNLSSYAYSTTTETLYEKVLEVISYLGGMLLY